MQWINNTRRINKEIRDVEEAVAIEEKVIVFINILVVLLQFLLHLLKVNVW